MKHPVGGSAPPLTNAAEAAQRVVDDAVVAAASVMMQQFPDVSEEETALFKELYELKHPTAASNVQALDDGHLEWSLRQAFGGASQSGQSLQPDEVFGLHKRKTRTFLNLLVLKEQAGPLFWRCLLQRSNILIFELLPSLFLLMCSSCGASLSSSKW